MFSFLHLAQSVPIFSEFLPKAHGPGGPLERPHVNFSCVTSVLHVLTNYHVFMTSVNYMYMCHIMRLCDMEHHVHTRTALIPIRRSRPLDKLDLVCTSKQFVGEPSTFAKKGKLLVDGGETSFSRIFPRILFAPISSAKGGFSSKRPWWNCKSQCLWRPSDASDRPRPNSSGASRRSFRGPGPSPVVSSAIECLKDSLERD